MPIRITTRTIRNHFRIFFSLLMRGLSYSSRNRAARAPEYITHGLSEGRYATTFDHLAPLLQHILIQLDHACTGNTGGWRPESRPAILNAPTVAFLNPPEPKTKTYLISRTWLP